MNTIALRVKRIEISSFNPRNFTANFKIVYSKNDSDYFFTISHDFKTRSEIITENIIKEIKSKAKPEENFKDDILDTLYSIKLTDDKRTEERLINFFARLNEKVKLLRIEKNHQKYMSQIADLNAVKLNLEGESNLRPKRIR